MLHPDHGRAPGALLKSADIAPYAAKTDGRGRAELSDRMLAHVVADMAGWRAAGVAFGRIAADAADAEFVRSDLVARVLDRPVAAGLSTDALELTETVLPGERAEAVGDTLGRAQPAALAPPLMLRRSGTGADAVAC